MINLNAELDTLEIKIKDNAKTTAKGIDKLTASLIALKAASEDGAGLESLNKETNKIKNTISNLKLGGAKLDTLKSAFNFGALATGLSKAKNLLSGFIDKSAEYTETLNLFNVAMGNYAKEAKNYADEVSEIMGIDPATWMKSQAVIMTLTSGFGVASDRAATMSKNLAQLGYDLSSFFNISVKDTMEKLQSGISGELEPLRRLGYDLSQAKLEAIALSLGIDKSVSSMTQAEKAELRYHAILTQVTTAQGDMARTLEQPANQLRLFEAAINQTSRAIGNIFIPLVNRMLPTAIAIVKTVEWVADSIAAIFGFKSADIDDTSLGGLADNITNIEDSLGGASGAAKELKRQVMGFDELNILTEQKSGGGGAGGISGSEFEFPLKEYDFLGDAVSSKATKIFEEIKSKAEPVVDWFVRNFKTILTTSLDIGAAILSFKIAKSALSNMKDFVSYLSLGHKKLDGWQSASRILAGLTIAITGINFSYDAGVALGSGSTELLDVLKGVLAPVVAGIGGALIMSPFGLGGAGFAIGLTLGVVFKVAGQIKGEEQSLKDKFAESEFGKEIAELDAQLAEGIARNTELRVRLDKITGEVDENTIANFSIAKQLIDEIFTLDAEKNKTSAEIQLINEKIVTLNSLGLEGVTLSFDEATGHINQTKDAVLQTMDALLRQYKIEALRESYIETYKAQYDATSNVVTANKNLENALSKYKTASDKATEANKKRNDALTNLNKFLEKNNITHEDAHRLTGELAEKYNELNGKYKETQEDSRLAAEATKKMANEVEKASGALSEAKGIYDDAATKIGNLEASLKNLASSTGTETEKFVKNGENMMLGLEEGLLTGGEKAKIAVDTISANMQRAMEISNDMHSPSVVYKDYGFNMMSGLEIGLKEGWEKIEVWWKSLTLKPFHIQVPHFNVYWDYNLLPSTQRVASQVYGVAALPSMSVSWYANGGYGIPNGQLFIANEAGPELVGQMNGRNTVANQEQIIEGIRQATYEGFMAAMANNSENSGESTFVFQVGEDTFATIATKAINKQTRELGYLALEGI